jgi:sulfur-oxidizing protein SoxY
MLWQTRFPTRRMVLLAAPALGLAPFGRSDASPTAMAEAIRALVGDANITTSKVKLELPPIVENGNTVSLTVSVDSPMTEAEHVISIHLFNEKNPQPYIAAFHLAPRTGRAAVSTRIRLADSQKVVAIARLSDASPSDWLPDLPPRMAEPRLAGAASAELHDRYARRDL